MTAMPTEITPDSMPAESGQRINGVVDVPRHNRVSGWAIDRADENASVTVTILREGRVVSEVRADSFRPDLERGGIGSGRYGFSVELDPPLEPGFAFTIGAVARADDGTSGELRPVGQAKPSDEADRRLAERTFVELSLLRAGLRTIAGRQERNPADLKVQEAIERIEVVQARLEQALASGEAPARHGAGRGLILAVALALSTGLGSLGLGIWSILAG